MVVMHKWPKTKMKKLMKTDKKKGPQSEGK